VPGHGGPLPQERAQQLLAEDVAYLDALAAQGGDAPLPEGRRSATQKQIHTANLAAVS
jgi:hypothetical protein